MRSGREPNLRFTQMAKAPRCAGKTKAGKPCRMPASLGTEFCVNHRPDAEEVKANLGIGGAQPGAGRPRRPRATEVLRERVEADIDRVLKPLFESLDAEKAVVIGGTKDEHGYVEFVPDMPTRLRAAADVLDRVYGKAKQTTEIAGPDGGPVRVEVPRSAERAAEVARILAGAGALPSSSPHEGRRRPAPAKPLGVTNGNGNGHR